MRNAAVEVEKIVEKVVEKEVLGDDFGVDQTTVNQTQQSSVSSGLIAQAGSAWASDVVHAAPVQRSPVQYSAPVKHQPPTQQTQMVLMQTGTKKEMRFVGYDFNYLSDSVVVCVYVHASILSFIHILVGTNQNSKLRWWKKRKKNQAPGACALLTTLQWDFRGSDRQRLLVMPPQSLVRVGLAAVEPLSPPPLFPAALFRRLGSLFLMPSLIEPN